MKANKINALEALVSNLEISDRELIRWVNNRSKKPAGLIPTELPLVYRQGNVLTVENGLNLSRKSELWGIQLLSGVMVALQCRNSVPSNAWGKVKKFVESLTCNAQAGELPSKDVLIDGWGTEEEAKFEATVSVLKKNDIEADAYSGCIWCAEIYNQDYACYFNLGYGFYDWSSKGYTYGDARVALFFN